MENLIKKILKESAKEKFINTMVDKLKSGVIKAPYFKNLKKFEVSKAERKEIFEKFFGEDITIEYDNTVIVINSLGNKIYDEGITGGWWNIWEYDERDNEIYYKDSDGNWEKSEYGERGNLIYRENSDGYWRKWEYDDRGNEIYYKDSHGYWWKKEYDEVNNLIYRENSIDGVLMDKR